MARPLFLWDLLLKLIFSVVLFGAAIIFWLLTPFFLILNLLVSWHRLWRYFGVWNLVTFRFIMRRRNLFDTASLPTKPPASDSRRLAWNPLWRTARTADGTFNDLQNPSMGRAGARFARNFSLNRLARLFPREPADLHARMLSPNPREISRRLLTRDRFKPASSLNLLAAVWIQFQVHDWFNHSRRPPSDPKSDANYLPPIPLDPEDPWPGGEQGRPDGCVMHVRKTEPDESVDRNCKRFPQEIRHLPIYRNTETHWWDGSQIYGSSLERQREVREHNGTGKLKIRKGRLPADPARLGIDLTGFNDNYWAGLSLLHTLFALEHNAICDALKQQYPVWDGERLFQTARLITTALMAKIHTVEWTPAILGHPTLSIGMRANWWGIVTQRLNRLVGRMRILRDVQEEITGIPGSEQDHHAAAFAMTEEFVSVYRMHPLIPDDYRIYSVQTDELKRACTFEDLHGDHTRRFVDSVGMDDLFYSFGVAHPGAISLNNFPRALQEFKRMRDGHHVFRTDDPVPRGEPELLDLGTVDLVRDRERAVPRYNDFRRMLLLLPCISYRRLVGVPLVRWLSSLTNREIEDRLRWARELRQRYPDKNDLDLLVGLLAENRPKGFGFSDTAFRVFVLMAPRRLKSDRFITTDFNPDVYTPLGMDWIENNDLKTVLLRHFPSLSPALDEVKNPFVPWQRTERPSPDPVEAHPATDDPRPIMRRVAAFQMPIFGGAFIGWIAGAILHAWTRPFGHGVLDSLATSTAVQGAAIGAIIGGFCLASLYAFTLLSTGHLSKREEVQSGAGWGAAIGWMLGGLAHLWATDTVLGQWGAQLWTAAGALVTKPAAIGALAGAVIGAVRERTISQLLRGACIGWVAGAAWTLWHTSSVTLPELGGTVVRAGRSLGTSWALTAAFVGAALGIAYGGRATLRKVWTPAGTRPFRWRAVYGAFFGGSIGAAAGLIWITGVSLVRNPVPMLAATMIALSFVVAGIGLCSARDSLVRRGWLRGSLVPAGALVVGLLSAAAWLAVWAAGRVGALSEMILAAIDTVTFHAAAGAAIGAVLGFAIWVGGWITLAALVGWLFGVSIYLAGELKSDLWHALFSSAAGSGAVTGTFAGVALMTVLVRETGWIVVGGIRGALMGALAGVAYELWQVAGTPTSAALFRGAWTSPQAMWGALLVALMVGAIWLVRGPEITWILRKTFWNVWGWFKFVGNRPLNVTPPRRRGWWKMVVWLRFLADRRAGAANQNRRRLTEHFWRCVKTRLDRRLRHSQAARTLDHVPVTKFREKFGIPIPGIDVAGSIPPEERSLVKTFLYRLQVHLYSVFSPMQPKELPPISADPRIALGEAYQFFQRRAFDPPDLPPEFEGSPDLGSLAVRGPYSVYLQRVQESSDDDPLLEWDLTDLAKFPVHDGLYLLGVRVLFRLGPSHLPTPYSIEYRTTEDQRKVSTPRDPDWQLAKKLALCAITTHQSLVRHFNWVHLAGGEHLALATRNYLPSDHPLCRFLWAHVYGTQQSNTVVTKGQMVRGGDFETIFSFTYEGMCSLFATTYGQFRLSFCDPEFDAKRRRVRAYLAASRAETSQTNLEELFAVLHRHAQRYLLLYYKNDGCLEPDESLASWLRQPEHRGHSAGRPLASEDVDLKKWIDALIGYLPPDSAERPRTLAGLARLLAQWLYLETVEHDTCGSFLWNYQLWVHRQPCRVYKNGMREPLDVYQRLVNANFNLNVRRLALMSDFSYLALDEQGAAAFSQFQKDLEAVQQAMDRKPWAAWKVYPAMLEANMNA